MNATSTASSASREAFRSEIARVAAMLDDCCRDRWWLIGSSAMALSIPEDDALLPGDIDVLTSRRDAKTVIESHHDLVDTAYRPAGDERFRSTFARFTWSPLPVEIMGGLEVRQGGTWVAAIVHDDDVIECAGASVRVPTRCEQIRLFELFGRGKDLAKARRLRDRLGQEAAHAVLG